MTRFGRLFGWVFAVAAFALIGASAVEAGPAAKCQSGKQPTDWCRPGSKEGERAYQWLRHVLAFEYPERLIQQIDKLPHCAECMRDPRAFVIEVVYAGSSEVKSQKWSAAEEIRHLDMLSRGVITKFRIRYAGDDCRCCDDEPTHSTVAWTDRTNIYDPPHDLTDVPPPPPPGKLTKSPYPPPWKEAHPSCQACAQAAEDYNRDAQRLYDYQKELVDIDYAMALANADDQRWSEYASYVDEIPKTAANHELIDKAQAEIRQGQQAATQNLENLKVRRIIVVDHIEKLVKDVAAEKAALYDCEAKRCRVSSTSAAPSPAPQTAGACTQADAVLAEINAARTDPKAYADKLRRYRAFYHDKLVREPGKPERATTEGTAAVDDAIAYLEHLTPRPPLKMSPELSTAAARFASDAGPAGRIGHAGSDGSTVGDRFLAVGVRAALGEEELSYQADNAEAAVRAMILDDGMPTRGHRKDLFDPNMTIAGVGCGPHKPWSFMFVVDLAGLLMPAPGSESRP
jgi:uncharacterized protein YkwD